MNDIDSLGYSPLASIIRTDRLGNRSAKGLGTKEDTGLKIRRWGYASPTYPVSFSEMMNTSTDSC